MKTCPNCGENSFETDHATGAAACTSCGTVVEENSIVSEITFTETASGASVAQGQFIPDASGTKPFSSNRSGFGGRSRESKEITLANARRLIQMTANSIRLGSYHVEAAQRLFMLAMEHNFIQGRRTQYIVAACLYVVCRRERTPHMLIDFSDVLQVNVFVLGQTFLKFSRLLNLKLPIIDPSLYIHRFASKLEFGDKTHTVAMTALRLVARMKRDWMQVGRRPAGICGASLLLAARLHGFRRSQKEIIYVVKIGDITLRKRLLEFEETPSSQLTPEEFETIDLEEEADPPSFSAARKKARLALSKAKEENPSIDNIDLNDLEMRGKEIDSKYFEKYEEKRQAKEEADMMKEEISDLEEEETSEFILTPEEVQLKSDLWHEMNKEYLKEQEEKKKLIEAGVTIRRPKKKKKLVDGKQAPPDSAVEATLQMLAQKKASKKINYEVLQGLFDDDALEPKTPINQVASPAPSPSLFVGVKEEKVSRKLPQTSITSRGSKIAVPQRNIIKQEKEEVEEKEEEEKEEIETIEEPEAELVDEGQNEAETAFDELGYKRRYNDDDYDEDYD